MSHLPVTEIFMFHASYFSSRFYVGWTIISTQNYHFPTITQRIATLVSDTSTRLNAVTQRRPTKWYNLTKVLTCQSTALPLRRWQTHQNGVDNAVAESTGQEQSTLKVVEIRIGSADLPHSKMRDNITGRSVSFGRRPRSLKWYLLALLLFPLSVLW